MDAETTLDVTVGLNISTYTAFTVHASNCRELVRFTDEGMRVADGVAVDEAAKALVDAYERINGERLAELQWLRAEVLRLGGDPSGWCK